MLEASKSDAVSEIDVIQAKSNLDQAKAAVISDKAALKTAETEFAHVANKEIKRETGFLPV